MAAKRYKAKYKSKKSGAADRALNKARMGDRPSLRRGLIPVLNWYNGIYEDPQTAYDAVTRYLIDQGAEKTLAKWSANKSFYIKYVTSHHWAMCDLILEGVLTDLEIINNFRKRLKKIFALEPEAATDQATIKYVTDKQRADNLIADLEEQWDQLMEHIRNKQKPPFNYKQFLGDRKLTHEMQEAVAAFYRPQYQEIVDAYKDRIDGYDKFSKGQLKVMAEFLKQICSYEVTNSPPPKPTSTTPRKSYYKPKGKKGTAAKKGRKTKAPLPAFHGKSAVVLYHPDSKQVTVLFAETGQKLELKKKTILNVDLNKSYAKRFGKQRDSVTNLKKSKFDKVIMFVGTVASAKLPATTRYRDGSVTINMKD